MKNLLVKGDDLCFRKIMFQENMFHFMQIRNENSRLIQYPPFRGGSSGRTRGVNSASPEYHSHQTT